MRRCRRRASAWAYDEVGDRRDAVVAVRRHRCPAARWSEVRRTLPVRAGVIPCRPPRVARSRRKPTTAAGPVIGEVGAFRRHRADALDAAGVLGRYRTGVATARGLSTRRNPGVWRHGDWVEDRSRRPRASSTAAATPTSIVAVHGWGRRSSTAWSRDFPESPTRSSSIRRRRAPRAGYCSSSVARTVASLGRGGRAEVLLRRIEVRALAPSRARRDPGGGGGATNTERQEVRGAGQAGARRDAGRAGGVGRSVAGPLVDGAVRRDGAPVLALSRRVAAGRCIVDARRCG